MLTYVQLSGRAFHSLKQNVQALVHVSSTCEKQETSPRVRVSLFWHARQRKGRVVHSRDNWEAFIGPGRLRVAKTDDACGESVRGLFRMVDGSVSRQQMAGATGQIVQSLRLARVPAAPVHTSREVEFGPSYFLCETQELVTAMANEEIIVSVGGPRWIVEVHDVYGIIQLI